MMSENEKENAILSKIPDLLQMGSHIATIVGMAAVVFTAYSYKVSLNQLKIMEYQISPKFRINVSIEPSDDTYEKFIQVTNLSYPIETEIETYAMMIVQIQDEGKNKIINILLNGYFSETTDRIENGTSMTDVLCRRDSNFCDSYLRNVMRKANEKINNVFISRDIPIYYDTIYFTKISYKSYDGKEVNKYYSVGNFENKEIEKSEFTKLLDTKESLDVGNYLNAPIDDELMAIIMKNIS